jgi:non-specific serine/threonine protein kinase/serine/threonine-protein kinase
VAPLKIQRRLRGDLDRIVMMALRKEPERRYGTVEQLCEDIRRYLEHRPVLARKATLGYVVSSFIARHTLAVAVSVLFGLALIGGIAAIIREARIAEMHEARANHRFEEVRKMANTLIFELDDSIHNLPGSTASRKVLIGTALKYLGSLSEQAAGDPALQVEMAAAYKRLGDIQSSLYQSEDDYKGGVESYRKALGLLNIASAAQPGNVRARRDSTLVFNSLSDVLWLTGDITGSLSYAEQALAVTQELAPQATTHFEKVFWSSVYEMDYGYKLFRMRGDTTNALRYMRAALAALEPLYVEDTSNASVRRLFVVSSYKTSEALLAQRSYADALLLNEKAMKVVDLMRASAPRDPDMQVNDAATKHFAAVALANLNRYDEATRYETLALDIARGLHEADPKVVEFQGFVSMALTGLADIAERQGQVTRAMPFLQEALAASDAALSAGTMHPYIRHSKGRTEALFGNAYALLGSDSNRKAAQRAEDWDTAREWYQRALGTFQKVSPIWAEAADDARHVGEQIAECNRVLASARYATDRTVTGRPAIGERTLR